ncbi:MAG: PAS domain S-box protein [Bacteroidales bacterium]|nr:PAS domain S-box protein [Bacteroidales bacterium]
MYKAFLQSPTPNVLTDKNAVIEFVNHSHCELTGYKASELIGKHTNIFKSGKHSPEFYQQMWSSLAVNKIWQGELINRKKNGELYWEYATISPIYDNEGNLVNYIKIAQDVTDQVEIKENWKQAKKEGRRSRYA